MTEQASHTVPTKEPEAGAAGTKSTGEHDDNPCKNMLWPIASGFFFLTTIMFIALYATKGDDTPPAPAPAPQPVALSPPAPSPADESESIAIPQGFSLQKQMSQGKGRQFMGAEPTMLPPCRMEDFDSCEGGVCKWVGPPGLGACVTMECGERIFETCMESSQGSPCQWEGSVNVGTCVETECNTRTEWDCEEGSAGCTWDGNACSTHPAKCTGQTYQNCESVQGAACSWVGVPTIGACVDMTCQQRNHDQCESGPGNCEWHGTPTVGACTSRGPPAGEICNTMDFMACEANGRCSWHGTPEVGACTITMLQGGVHGRSAPGGFSMGTGEPGKSTGEKALPPCRLMDNEGCTGVCEWVGTDTVGACVAKSCEDRDIEMCTHSSDGAPCSWSGTAAVGACHETDCGVRDDYQCEEGRGGCEWTGSACTTGAEKCADYSKGNECEDTDKPCTWVGPLSGPGACVDKTCQQRDFSECEVGSGNCEWHGTEKVGACTKRMLQAPIAPGSVGGGVGAIPPCRFMDHDNCETGLETCSWVGTPTVGACVAKPCDERDGQTCDPPNELDGPDCEWDGSACSENPCKGDNGWECEVGTAGCVWDGSNCKTGATKCSDMAQSSTCETSRPELACTWVGPLAGPGACVDTTCQQRDFDACVGGPGNCEWHGVPSVGACTRAATPAEQCQGMEYSDCTGSGGSMCEWHGTPTVGACTLRMLQTGRSAPPGVGLMAPCRYSDKDGCTGTCEWVGSDTVGACVSKKCSDRTEMKDCNPATEADASPCEWSGTPDVGACHETDCDGREEAECEMGRAGCQWEGSCKPYSAKCSDQTTSSTCDSNSDVVCTWVGPLSGPGACVDKTCQQRENSECEKGSGNCEWHGTPTVGACTTKGTDFDACNQHDHPACMSDGKCTWHGTPEVGACTQNMYQSGGHEAHTVGKPGPGARGAPPPPVGGMRTLPPCWTQTFAHCWGQCEWQGSHYFGSCVDKSCARMSYRTCITYDKCDWSGSPNVGACHPKDQTCQERNYYECMTESGRCEWSGSPNVGACHENHVPPADDCQGMSYYECRSVTHCDWSGTYNVGACHKMDNADYCKQLNYWQCDSATSCQWSGTPNTSVGVCNPLVLQ